VLVGCVVAVSLVPASAPADGVASSSQLPDARVNEPVTLPSDSSLSAALPPSSGHGTTTASGESPWKPELPVRAAADGDGVAYSGLAPASEGSGNTASVGGDTFLATRSTSGWRTTDLTPPIENAVGLYQGFSGTLSLALLSSFEVPAVTAAPPGCDVLYSRPGGTYQPVFTTTDTPGNCGVPVLAGVSGDERSVLFESEARLTPDATEEGNEGVGTATYNLYDSFAGNTYLVNKLPGGAAPANAAVGGLETEPEHSPPNNLYGGHVYGGAVNADGSRVFWTDLSTGALYVREDPAAPDATTLPIAEEASFRGASADGSNAFFTDSRRLTADATAESEKPDLYVCELPSFGAACRFTDLSPDTHSGEAVDVLGVLGNSDDGSHVYFVAEGLLAENENAAHETATAGQPNLYLAVGGRVTFIATLSPADDTIIRAHPGGEEATGDWQAPLSTRTAEVTPDGQAVEFMSHRSLTGYPNNNLAEVYVFQAADGQLSCASCRSSGAAPASIRPESQSESVGGFVMLPWASTALANRRPSSIYQLRSLSASGGRVFFDSEQPVVPAAPTGVDSVYEWERVGEGSCSGASATAANGGCVYLLSGSESDEESTFIDADESGANVFFTTRAHLVPEDRNDQMDVYDARVDGGISRQTTACTGTGCQGVPPAAPTFATPASTTFSGTGNFPPPLPESVPRPKKTATQIRSAQLSKALKSCHRDKSKKKRSTCEKTAHKKYGRGQ
jgi:hypothetical protein